MPEHLVNGLRYAYDVLGSGPPLLLLHGFTGSRAAWGDHLPALARRHTVVAVDLPGHGDTAAPADPARYAMPAVAADLVALLVYIFDAEDAEKDAESAKEDSQNALRPLRREAPPLRPLRSFLLGYSMGGRLALYLAAHHPHLFGGLILESASPGLETAAARAARRQQDAELADWIAAHGIPAFVDRWEALPLWRSQAQLPAEARAALRARRLQNSAAGLANSLRGMGTGVQPSLWPALPRLPMPTLLLAGALDDKFVRIQQQMAAALPRAQAEIIPGAGHTVHLERPLAFRQRVLEFLQG